MVANTPSGCHCLQLCFDFFQHCIYCVFCVHVCTGIHTHREGMWKSEDPLSSPSRFSPSPRGLWVIELRSLGLVASPFTHRAISLAFFSVLSSFLFFGTYLFLFYVLFIYSYECFTWFAGVYICLSCTRTMLKKVRGGCPVPRKWSYIWL